MENGMKILLVEDNPGDARLVSEMLRECVTLSFRITHAVRIDEALKILKGEKFNVVLLDLNLPDSRGLDSIEKITAQEPTVPVIIFTGVNNETLGIQAMRKHAGDYLVKGQINSNILVRSIRYAIERKRVEQVIRESEARFRALAEALPAHVWTADAQGRVDWFNERWAEYTGQEIEKGKGWGWGSIVHPDDLGRTVKKWKGALRTKAIFEDEVRVRGGDGEYRWFLIRAWPLHNRDGNVVRWFGTNTDVHVLKQAEMDMRESREVLNRAQTIGKIGNWRLNIQQNVLIWSDENYRIFGVPKVTSLTYESFLSLVHPDDRDYVDKKWKSGMAGEDYDIEHRIIADGKVKWVREKAFLEVNKQGVLLAGFGITQDITERKLIEEELRKSRDELEIRVQERTSELNEVVEALQKEMDERKQVEEKLKATNALLSLFSRKTSRKDYLDAVADLVHSWSGCRCVGIRILDEKGYIPYESYVGFSREFWESENRLSIEHDQCVCIRVITGNPDPQEGSVMTPGGSFHCDDTVAFIGRLSAEEKARFRGVCIQNGFLSLNVIPIRYNEKVLGTIHLADKEREKLPLTFIEFFESMSPLIGEAINRFNLEDELRNSENRLRFLSSQLLTVQENERKRISSELHDDIAAKLAAIKFTLEKKLMQPGKVNDETTQSLKGIISMVVDTISSARRIMINLRPAMIDDLGILATLNWYCREFEQIFTTIRVEKQTNIKENEIPENLKIVIFRIVQEGMHNIAKHSGANHVALTLEKINDVFTLSIEDNGRGFDAENKTLDSEIFQGFGLVNMEERARLSGGDFSVKSLKEKGTFIKVTWSLKPMEMTYNLRIEPS